MKVIAVKAAAKVAKNVAVKLAKEIAIKAIANRAAKSIDKHLFNKQKAASSFSTMCKSSTGEDGEPVMAKVELGIPVQTFTIVVTITSIAAFLFMLMCLGICCCPNDLTSYCSLLENFICYGCRSRNSSPNNPLDSFRYDSNRYNPSIHNPNLHNPNLLNPNNLHNFSLLPNIAPINPINQQPQASAINPNITQNEDPSKIYIKNF